MFVEALILASLLAPGMLPILGKDKWHVGSQVIQIGGSPTRAGYDQWLVKPYFTLDLQL